MDGNNVDKELPGELDLSSLSSLSFRPAWASGDNAEKISVGRISRDDRRGNAPRRERHAGSDGASRDRRPPRPRTDDAGAPRNSFGGENRPPRREFRGDSHRDGARGNAPRGNAHRGRPHAGTFPPPRVVEVSFFPEEKPFNVLIKAVKASARTYALFEIANLILEKPDRFTVSVKPFVPAKKKPAPADVPAEASKPAAPMLYVCVPDGMPFLSEADAFAYTFEHHADKFFSVETVEVEPPKGNFTMVAKCGFTGELLAPPNYHAYQQILRDWHAANFPKMPFEKFMSRLETVRDQESVDAWIAKMKTVVRYTVKDRKDGEPETLDGAGAARAFLLASRKDKAVRAVGAARFPGKLLEQMPMGPMKAGIEKELEFQRRFPLDTANFLRGRLRRAGFSLFKRGAKGITLVCAVRRKFRTPDSVFSETIQRVFDFLEKHPNTKVQDLPKMMLGIGDEPSVPAALAEGSSTETVPAEAAPAAAEPNNNAQLSELLGCLRWLVLEGYVSELSDGSLFTYPKMTAAQAKVAAKEDGESGAKSDGVPAEEKPDDIAAEIPSAEIIPAEIAPKDVPATDVPAMEIPPEKTQE